MVLLRLGLPRSRSSHEVHKITWGTIPTSYELQDQILDMLRSIRDLLSLGTNCSRSRLCDTISATMIASTSSLSGCSEQSIPFQTRCFARTAKPAARSSASASSSVGATPTSRTVKIVLLQVGEAGSAQPQCSLCTMCCHAPCGPAPLSLVPIRLQYFPLQ